MLGGFYGRAEALPGFARRSLEKTGAKAPQLEMPLFRGLKAPALPFFCRNEGFVQSRPALPKEVALRATFDSCAQNAHEWGSGRSNERHDYCSAFFKPSVAE